MRRAPGLRKLLPKPRFLDCELNPLGISSNKILIQRQTFKVNVFANFVWKMAAISCGRQWLNDYFIQVRKYLRLDALPKAIDHCQPQYDLRVVIAGFVRRRASIWLLFRAWIYFHVIWFLGASLCVAEPNLLLHWNELVTEMFNENGSDAWWCMISNCNFSNNCLYGRMSKSARVMLPDGTKTLHELMLTCYDWCSVAFTKAQFHKYSWT